MSDVLPNNPLLQVDDLSWQSYIWLLTRIFIAEMIGSGILILPLILINSPTQYEALMAGIAVGGGLYVAIWTVYPVSGAHLNPVISLTALLNSQIKVGHLLLYWAAQLAGALLSTLVGDHITPFGKNDTYSTMTFPRPEVSEGQALLAEAFTTTILVIVYLATVDERRPENWGLATGLNMAMPLMFAMMGCVIIAEPISNGCMNPFRSLGPAILHNHYRQQWLYVVGPLIGALLGSILHIFFLAARMEVSDLNNHYAEYLPIFTLKNEISCRGHMCLLLSRLFVTELVASAMITLPYFLIDSRLNYCAISEALAVAGLVYAAVWVTYPLSGAQLNPIITLAFGLTRRISFFYVPFYWAGQFMGAGLAMTLAFSISPFSKLSSDFGVTLPRNGTTMLQAVGLECLITSLLLIVILTGTDEARDPIWTMGDGSTLACVYMLMYLVNTIITKNLTGASMNPFRSIVAAILQSHFNYLWIYFAGPGIGCLIAVIFTEVVLTEDACWLRTKAWLTDIHYYRNHSYSVGGLAALEEEGKS